MKENPNGILFFDEITTCSPVIQVALLSIIQDSQFGEFEIPKQSTVLPQEIITILPERII
jgi:MoxR-like ATPase